MAYSKKSTKSRNSRSGYSRSKSASKRSSRSTGRKPTGRSVQTLRIVVEQPSAVSSVPGVVTPANQNAARKAVF